MPVTLQLADLAPRAWPRSPTPSPSKLFAGISTKEFNRSKRIVQSSVSKEFLSDNNVSHSTNGLVHTILSAWSGHHHLILRPEDIWFAILSQLNFFINAHAEELRSFFVAHDGRKQLEVVEIGNINSVDFGDLAIRMTREIEKTVIDPELRTWIIPEFSTTTQSDRIIAAVLMMGALQKYFSYKMRLECGIPSVTLLGERNDWAILLQKLDRIPQLGSEPTRFTELLRPVLERFVRTFDAIKGDNEIADFWNRCAHETSGSGPFYLSGWVTAFCFWDEDGNCLNGNPERPVTWKAFQGRNAGCELDNVLYHRVDTDKISPGYAFVPVTVDDNGKLYNTKLLAGSVGIQACSSGQALDEDTWHEGSYRRDPDGRVIPWMQRKASEASGPPGLDSLKPLSAWWMYEVESSEDEEQRKIELKTKREEYDSMSKVAGLEWGSEKSKRRRDLLHEILALEEY
ncbi:MAG: hypothetical protein Q9227_004432 [Pyrenula ochraceoflavens]